MLPVVEACVVVAVPEDGVEPNQNGFCLGKFARTTAYRCVRCRANRS